MAKTSTLATTEPKALLDYIDQFMNLLELKARESELLNELLESQTEIQKAEGFVDKIPATVRALATTKQQLNALKEAKGVEIIEYEQQLATEKSLRADIKENLDEIETSIQSAIPVDALNRIKQVADPKLLVIGSTNLRTIIEKTELFEKESKQHGVELLKGASELVRTVDSQLTEWSISESKVREQIAEKRTELARRGITLDTKFVVGLAESEAKLTKELETLKKWKEYLRKIRQDREKLLTVRFSVRSKISGLRSAYGSKASKSLTGTLGDLTISIKYLENGLCPTGEVIIKEVMGWRTIQVPRARIIVEQVTIPRLLQCIANNDVKPLLACKLSDGGEVFNKSEANGILARLRQPSTLFSLQQIEIDDLPRITVTKSIEKGGSQRYVTKDFARLSLGQQQSVLLAIMLTSNSTTPLVIDQPEDHLDGEFIFHSLVPVLRKAKERRQIIIVTHNANLAVLTDAEQIIALKSVSDKGHVIASGSIDNDDVREFASRILEGAKSAFTRRGQLYGFH